jgi:AraC family transcriptional regulator
MSAGVYGAVLGASYRMADAQAVVARSRCGALAAATRLEGDGAEPFTTGPMAREEGFLITVSLREVSGHLASEQGRPLAPVDIPAGATLIQDLRLDPRCTIDQPFDAVSFYVPCALLQDARGAATEDGAELVYAPGQPILDQTLHCLAISIKTALEGPGGTSSLFLDEVVLAAAAHIAHVYGRRSPAPARGSLAPWQFKRAQELLIGNLEHAAPLETVATACGLSVSQFSRGFQTITGHTPHRWLLEKRVEAVKSCLEGGALSLAEVAAQAGFADQSHMTRVFTKLAGVSPGAWRKRLLN